MNKTQNDNAQTVRIVVAGSKGATHTITVPASGAPAYCSCPAWKFQKIAPALRTCKHLNRFASRFNA